MVEEEPWRNVVMAVEEGDSSNPTDAVLFVGISLVLGIASRHLLRGTRVPYTVALLVLGIGLGSLGIVNFSLMITLFDFTFGLFGLC